MRLESRNIAKSLRHLMYMNSMDLPKMQILDCLMWQALQNALKETTGELEWIDLGPQLSSIIRNAPRGLLGCLSESSACSFVVDMKEEDFFDYYDRHEKWKSLHTDLRINYFRSRFASIYWTAARDFATKSKLDCMSIFHISRSFIDRLAESNTSQIIDFCHGYPALQSFRLTCSIEDCLAVVRRYETQQENGKNNACTWVNESAAQLLKTNHCASSALFARRSLAIEKQVGKLLSGGSTAAEVSERLSISPHIISVLEHQMVRNNDQHSSFDGFWKVIADAYKTGEPDFKTKEGAAKHLGQWLVEAGLQPGQVHVVTGLSIHKCRRLFGNREKDVGFDEQLQDCDSRDLQNSELRLPQNPEPRLPFRVIASLFAAHYLYLQEASEDTSIQLDNIVVAWDRTICDVLKHRINKWPGFEPNSISLGPLFNLVIKLRKESKSASPESGVPMQKVFHQWCVTCKSYFVGFTSSRYAKASQCCFCELKKRARIGLNEC